MLKQGRVYRSQWWHKVSGARKVVSCIDRVGSGRLDQVGDMQFPGLHF